MSKLMGKIILKTREAGGFVVSKWILKAGLSVRYLKTSNCFEFKGFRLTREDLEAELEADGLSLKEIGEGRSRYILVVPAAVVSAMILADKVSSVVCHWSVGYETQEKLGYRPGDFALLRDREMKFIGSCLTPEEDEAAVFFDVDSFYDLSVWQYLFNISETVLKSVRKAWKRRKWGRGDVGSGAWVSLRVRENFGGRKPGSKGIRRVSSVLEESEEDFNERISHNKKVAVEKGFLAWYLEACKEECKRRGVRFERESCVDAWNKLRESYESDIDF